MSRKPRISIIGVPQHVIQRGNNRQAIFDNDEDRQAYITWLKDAADKRKGVRVIKSQTVACSKIGF